MSMYHLTPDDVHILSQFPANSFGKADHFFPWAAEAAEALACRGLLIRNQPIDYGSLRGMYNQNVAREIVIEHMKTCQYRLSRRAIKLAQQNHIENQFLLHS